MESAAPLCGSQGMGERYPCQLGNVPRDQLFFQETRPAFRDDFMTVMIIGGLRGPCLKQPSGSTSTRAGYIVLQSGQLWLLFT